MSTTMLERTNPLEQLRPRAAGREGVARRMLAELDDEVTEIFSALEFDSLTPIRPVSEPRTSLMSRLRPARRPDPRRFEYPVTWNLPKPKRAVRPRITVLHVAGPAVAKPAEMPRVLAWPPMLRASRVNDRLDANWRALFSQWDGFREKVAQKARVMGKLARLSLSLHEREAREELATQVESAVRDVWIDFLGIYGEMGTVRNHVAGRLARLELLAT